MVHCGPHLTGVGRKRREIQARVPGRLPTSGPQGSRRSGAWAPARRIQGSRVRSARSEGPGSGCPGTRESRYPRSRVPGTQVVPGPGVQGLSQHSAHAPPCASAPVGARSLGGAEPRCCCFRGSAPGGADHAAGGPAPAQLTAPLYPTSGLPRRPLRAALGSHFGRGSAPLPPPLPRSWPLRTRPLRPGPGLSPAALCLSRARPGPRPAAAPRPPRRLGTRAAARAARSDPEPGRRSLQLPDGGAGSARGVRPKEGAGRRARPPPGPTRGLRASAGGVAEHDGALGGPRPPLGIAVRGYGRGAAGAGGVYQRRAGPASAQPARTSRAGLGARREPRSRSRLCGDPRMGAGTPRFRLRGRPRSERGTEAWGRWLGGPDCRCSGGWGPDRATLAAARAKRRGLLHTRGPLRPTLLAAAQRPPRRPFLSCGGSRSRGAAAHSTALFWAPGREVGPKSTQRVCAGSGVREARGGAG